MARWTGCSRCVGSRHYTTVNTHCLRVSCLQWMAEATRGCWRRYTPLSLSYFDGQITKVEVKLCTEPNVTWTCSYKGKAEYLTLRVALRTFCALQIRRCWARHVFKTQSRRTYWKQLFPQIPFNTLHDNENVTSLLKSAQEPERNHDACMMLDTSCDSPQ